MLIRQGLDFDYTGPRFELHKGLAWSWVFLGGLVEGLGEV